MASTPNCRIASASLSAPAGYSGLPVPSDSSSSSFLAADELLQRQLDELTAIHRRLQQLDGTLRPALDPAFPHPPATGNFLVFPELWRFQRALASLEAECGALARATQTRLDRTRRGIQQLRGLAEREGAFHECH